MLERNILAHIKVALLLSLLSSACILHVRLVPDVDDHSEPSKAGVPLASVLFAGSLIALSAGGWEYYNGCRDLMDMRAFLIATKYAAQLAVMSSLIFCSGSTLQLSLSWWALCSQPASSYSQTKIRFNNLISDGSIAIITARALGETRTMKVIRTGRARQCSN
jgi:hypothetical protein